MTDWTGQINLEHWSGAVDIDCGDAQAQQELIEQARRNIEMLPDSPGICIDNMGVVTCMNYGPGADDKVGWYGDGWPGRFLALSWIDTLSKIGPILHQNGRVIFGNSCFTGHRLDVFRQLDGIFDESGDLGYAFNGSSLIAIRKTAVMWNVHYEHSPARPRLLLPAAPLHGRLSDGSLSRQRPQYLARCQGGPVVSGLRPAARRDAWGNGCSNHTASRPPRPA